MESNTRSEPPLRERDFLTRQLRARPLATGAALFLLGCVLQHAWALPAAAPWAALAGMLLAAAVLGWPAKRRRLAAALLALALLPAGMLRFAAAWRAVEPLPERTLEELSGRISDEPEFNPETQRTVCTLDSLTLDGAPVRGKVQLYLRGDVDALRGVKLGQRIFVPARLWVSDGATNPGQFDMADYRRSRGLRNYATAKIEDARFEDAPARPGDYLARVRDAPTGCFRTARRSRGR